MSPPDPFSASRARPLLQPHPTLPTTVPHPLCDTVIARLLSALTMNHLSLPLDCYPSLVSPNFVIGPSPPYFCYPNTGRNHRQCSRNASLRARNSRYLMNLPSSHMSAPLSPRFPPLLRAPFPAPP